MTPPSGWLRRNTQNGYSITVSYFSHADSSWKLALHFQHRILLTIKSLIFWWFAQLYSVSSLLCTITRQERGLEWLVCNIVAHCGCYLWLLWREKAMQQNVYFVVSIVRDDIVISRKCGFNAFSLWIITTLWLFDGHMSGQPWRKTADILLVGYLYWDKNAISRGGTKSSFF